METASLTEQWARAHPGVRARARWELLSRPAQRTPPGDWNIWLYMAGRGAGKTRSAAEDMAYYGMTHPRRRLAIVAPTYADARDTCIEGESGLLACLPREVVGTWNRSLGELVLRNGTRYKLFGSDEPDRLRGPQHHRAWCDELASFRNFDTWDMLMMGLRLGEKPQCVVTTTPRPVQVVKDLLARRDVVVTKGTTWENAANLAPAALESLRRRYEGTRLGRQELEGLLIEDVEGALWNSAMIESNRVADLPPNHFWQSPPVIGVDTADGKPSGDMQSYTVVGLSSDHRLYVVEQEAMRVGVDAFAGECIDAALRHHGRIVLEANHGGAFAKRTFEVAMRERGAFVPLEVVHASQGKRTRAEPVAALYEQGRVSHVGQFPELEDQMTSFTGAAGEKSPDRLDSLVWAVWKFTGYSFGPPAPEHLDAAVPYTTKTVGTDEYGNLEGAVAWR